jgi:hypothetical protein
LVVLVERAAVNAFEATFFPPKKLMPCYGPVSFESHYPARTPPGRFFQGRLIGDGIVSAARKFQL